VEILQAPNFRTHEGLWGTPLPGFGFAECDRIVTDSLGHMVTWKGNGDLSALKGRAVYLRFKMKKAGLFSFQLSDSAKIDL
jgi:hypothetical protein